MRPPIAVGEVFATVELASGPLGQDANSADDGPGVVWKLYRAARPCPSGRPVVACHFLAPLSSDHAEDASLVQHQVPDVATEPVSHVASQHIVVFYGKRPIHRSADDTGPSFIELFSSEVETTGSVVTTGYLSGGATTMSLTPLNVRVDPRQVGEHTAVLEEDPTAAPLGVPGNNTSAASGKRRQTRTEGHFWSQTRSLLRKDFTITRASPKTTCCVDCCIPVLMFLIIGLWALGMKTGLDSATNQFSRRYPGWQYGERFVSNTSGSQSSACQFNVSNISLVSNRVVSDGYPLYVTSLLDRVPGCRGVTSSNATLQLSTPAIAQATTAAIVISTLTGASGAEEIKLDFNVFAALGDQARDALRSLQASVSLGAAPRTLNSAFAISYETTEEIMLDDGSIRVQTASQLPLYILLGLAATLIRNATRIVDEKREGFREHLRAMGCGDGAYIFSIFFSIVVRTAPAIVLLTVFVRIVWWKGLDVFLVYLMMQLFVVSMSSASLFLPVVFDSSAWAAATMIVLTLGSIIGTLFITVAPAGVQILFAVLFPPSAAYFGLAEAFARDQMDLEVPYGACVAILICQVLFWTPLSQYLYRLFPGKHGTSAHPLFCCITEDAAVTRGRAFGSEDTSKSEAISLRRLKKYFGDQRETATVDLSLDVHHGEILALLGHNGAGKTTTISMLTGLLRPTEYECASVAGFDVSDQMHLIRQNIGLCPQHDVLFPTLSARGHLMLFASMRGVELTDARCDELLMFLDLPLNDQEVTEFSGGMKRRVSVACAVVGEPAVVFLDEPTTGLDEVSRTKIWELLKLERTRGTTMVLTTHLMEEAEALGDRIAIMSSGQLATLGTTMELKARHGAGYYLSITRADQQQAAAAEKRAYDGAAVYKLLMNHCPSATLNSENAFSQQYFIPQEDEGGFPDMLETLESELETLGAASYGLTMSTLEDVFISLAESTQRREDDSDAMVERITRDVQELHQSELTRMFDEALDTPPSTAAKIAHDTLTVFMKRVRAARHAKMNLVLQLIVPLALIIGAWAAAYNQPTGEESDDGNAEDDRVFVPIYAPPGRYTDAQVERFRAKMHELTQIEVGPGRTVYTSVWNDVKPIAGGDFTRENYFAVTKSARVSQAMRLGCIVMMPLAPGDMLRVGSYFAGVSTTCAMSASRAYDFWFQTEVLGVATPELLPRVVAEQHSPTGGAPSNNNDGAQRKPMLLMFTAMIYLVAIMFQTLPVMMTLQDELNRAVLDSMMIHGLTEPGYWIGNFCFDVLFTLLFPISVPIGLAVRDIPYWDGSESDKNAGIFFATLALVVCLLLYTYMFLAWLRRAALSSHIAIAVGMLMLCFFLPFMVISIMRVTTLKLEHPGWPMLESITPQYCWFVVFNYKRDFSRFRDPAGGVQSIMLWVHCLFPLGLLLARVSRGSFVNRFEASSSGIPQEMFSDRDVVAELRRIDAATAETGRSDDVIAANHCWKEYDGGKVAVQGVTFGVHDGEVFGLLGTNGAGKSTSMRLLQLETDPSGGSVTFGQLPPDFQGSVNVARQRLALGVCQQHDSLFGALTGEQHLALYLKLRLGPRFISSQWAPYIAAAMATVQLPLLKRVEQYSGGMKRRLATAIAVYTGARIMFLDEPSTGLDPFARRLLWRVIATTAQPGKAMVLTTHSMEEAEAVCGRITIVTTGLMRCLGTSQHLKDRFGLGYVATLVTTPQSNVDAIDQEMLRQFGNAATPKVVGFLRQYNLSEVRSPAMVYRVLSRSAEAWHLERFAVSQSTLQQVFVSFASGAPIGR